MLDRVFSLETIYLLSGLTLVLFGVFTARDRGNSARFGTALFWFLLGLIFALGSVMPSWATGVLLVALVALDGLGVVRQGSYGEASEAERQRSADKLGLGLFVPVLMIPFLTASAYLALRGYGFDPNRIIYVSLGFSSVLAAGVALAITRAKPAALVHEGRRLADAIGAVVILPQFLAALGELFKSAGVGDTIAWLVGAVIPTGNLFAVVFVLCASIALFTFVVGNSFAAFPVIIAGVGVPLLIDQFQANAALVGAITITAASCGTLCTPMAANFNLVPPALFEMRDRYGVIRFQAPFAAAMFVVHVLLLWSLISLGYS
jgi:uncharacterized membrane protein